METAFTPKCPVSSLLSVNTTGRPYGTPQPILSQLQGPINITALDVSFSEFDTATLDTLCTFFPHLTKLIITTFPNIGEEVFEPVASKATKFFESLADTTLPPTLRHLALSCGFECESALMFAGEMPAFTDLCVGPAVRCPNLTSFWLDRQDFLFQWHKVRDGTAHEDTAHDFRDANIMRMTFALFWETGDSV
ncbi:hypothetical protein B0H17DRAFT_1215176 [Mycena rosella]|uniref:Uncharacterized protein n=1 Tax=Mycena rosella TaxID=1033263 RepID=A0AAD7CL93_MYCRO|nr:hypothetical protein B0H17DRAFT_1215176 [Mycena rosella]